MRKAFQKIITVLFTLTSIIGLAQVYPVQMTPVFNVPYSSRISDYATSMDVKMQLLVNPSDITITNRQVRLKIYIQGNNLNVQSNDNVIGMNPIYINGGELLTLTNLDIAPLFRLENLQGINPAQYANSLPEGMYSVCFEMYDYITNQRISQKSCANLYLMLNDPPLLNTPARNESIAVSEFPNILFTWTPRQINATNVSYQFELKEILDPTIDPQIGFLTSPVLYQEELYSTALLYDLSKPNLLPGKRYAWRVKAVSTSGLSQNNVFKNDGYSEIYHFTYASHCPVPTFILSEALSARSVRISWLGNDNHTKYHVQYRKANVAGAEWFEVYTMNTQTTISDLEAGITYEFRVGGSCEPAVLGNTASFTYSGINQFTMPAAGTSNSTFTCGLGPTVAIANQTPITNLIVSETFTAGDFPVKILELTGNNPYTGKGYIIVPYLADTKIAVIFNNITVNTNYQLINGIVETSYNPDAPNIIDLEDLTNNGDVTITTVPFVITNIAINPAGDIVISGANGQQITIPGGGNNQIVDSAGNVYTIDENGNMAGPFQQAAGGAPTPANTDGVASNGQATAITAEGVLVTFEKASDNVYGFDSVAANANSKIKTLYKSLGSNYYMPYKSILNTTDGGVEDYILARIEITDTTIKADSIVFKTEKGIKIESTKISNTEYKLILKGNYKNTEIDILASIKQGDKYKIAGAFKLLYLAKRTTAKVILVNTDNATIPNKASLQNYLNNIYKVAGASFEVIETLSLTIDDKLSDVTKIDSGESGFAANYTSEQQAINSAIMATPVYNANKDAYFLIVTNKKPSKADEKGFMPLGRQFGYIFSGDNHTIAHELGHGIFQLKHPFSTTGYNFPKASTSWLMDYTTTDDLPYVHWKEIQNPSWRIGIFDSDAEGEFTNAHLTPDWIPFNYSNSNTFTIPDNTINTDLNPNGAVYGIVVKNGEDKEYYNWGEKNGVKGYYYNSKRLDITTIENSKITDNLVIDLFWNNGKCGTHKSFTTKWKHIKDKKGSITLNYLGQPDIVTGYNELPCLVDGLSVGSTRYDRKCNTTDFSTLYTEIKGLNEFAESIESKEKSEIVNKILNASYCALKDITIENKIKYTREITNKFVVGDDSEKALIKLLNVIKEEEIDKFYDDYLKVGDNLSKMLTKIENKFAIFFGDNNRDYFLESLAYQMVKLKTDERKWFIINTIIKSLYNKIKEGEYEKKALVTLTSSLDGYKDNINKLSGTVDLVSKMLIEDCESLNDFKIIFDIALIRNNNREIFSQFTQGDVYEYKYYNPGNFRNYTYTVTPSETNWSWVYPKNFVMYASNIESMDKINGIYLVDYYFEWKKYLNENPSVAQKKNSEIEAFLDIFKNKLSEFINTKATDNLQFWNNTTISCETLNDCLEHIDRFENVESLKKLAATKKLSLVENYFNCNNQYDNTNNNSVDSNILKILLSFDETDSFIITKLESITMKKVYEKLSSSNFSKFIIWLSYQSQQCNTLKQLNPSDIVLSNGNIKSSIDSYNKLEADFFKWENLGAKITGNKVNINGTNYDYNQLVLVYVSGSFEYLSKPYKKGTLLKIPAIEAFALGQKTNTIIAEKSAWLLVDTLLMFSGIGEIKVFFTAGNYIRKAIVISDLAGSSAGIVVNLMNEDAIDPDTRFKIQLLSIVASLPHLATSVKGIDNMIKSVDDKLNVLTNANTRTGLTDYFGKIKLRLPNASKIEALLNKLRNTAVWAKYDNLTADMKKIFENDFANASDEVINSIKNEDAAFNAWKKYRENYTNRVICN